MTKCAWLTILVLLVLLAAIPACNLRRGSVEAGPGETSEELDAAGRVLSSVGDSVPLVTVQVSTTSGSEERRTVGVVVGDRRRILVDATAVSLNVGSGEQAEVAHTRSIEAVFHPGGEDEQRHAAEVVRLKAERGMALLSMEGDAPSSVALGDDVPDDARAFLISVPLNTGRLVSEAGSVRGYNQGEAGRFLLHTAGHEPGVTGPVFDAEGELIGLQTSRSVEERTAIPAVEIAQWLRTPDAEELPPAEPGRVLSELLSRMDVHLSRRDDEEGYAVRRGADAELLVRQRQGVISVETDLGTLHAGDAIEALRSNYSDPVGALALRPAEGSDELVWVARLSADAANAVYLEYVMRMAAVERSRWQRISAGLEADYPYEHYPGGDEEKLAEQLAGIVTQSGLPNEASGEGHKLYPDATVPVFTNEFQGMAYVFAYSGGVPGDDAAEQEQIARELVRRNWEMPLGRLALDKHLDLAWEAQVPMEHLTPQYLGALARVCQAEVSRIDSTYGDIPFNEQEQ